MKWSNKRILITGGAGFIGAHLAGKLVDENAEVVVVDNFSFGNLKNIPEDCQVITGNVAEVETFKEVDDVDYIFHFGAASSVILFNENPQRYIYETIFGFVNVMNFASKMKVKKLIFPSSGSVYGKALAPQNEDTSIPQPMNLYGKCKLICEQISSLYCVPTVGLRIFAGYGPGEGHKGRISSVVTLFLNSILNKERPIVYGDGSQRRDFIYIDDVIKAILNSAEGNIQGRINVGSGDSYSFNEVLDKLNENLNKRVKAQYIDKPTDYLETTLADTNKMKDLLKVNPVSLEEGIRSYLSVKGLIS
jgi:UDP-glucose 4-epimerase